jgi:hypothetical protein
MRVYFPLLSLALGCSVIVGACGGGNKGSGGGGADSGASDSSSSGGSSGGFLGDGNSPEVGPPGDPTTCAAAATSSSYLGCDYWPTVTANNVWSVFDFAVAVANGGASPATVTVTGGGTSIAPVIVAPGQLATIYLPWVTALKGADADSCGDAVPLAASVLQAGGAYHLVSSVPVTVYQFNALEYIGQGGPAGKDWSMCPGNAVCGETGQPIGCYSFSNDASLLLPSTAMTGNYRVTGHPTWDRTQVGTDGGSQNLGAYVAITATKDNTTVTLTVSSTGTVVAGTGISATAAGGTLTLTMNAGDVAELVGTTDAASDLSGSIIHANEAVQVITGLPCLEVPNNSLACDHVEESNFPAETFGQDYIVAQPTGPLGNAVGQLVRIYGNFDGTDLTYIPGAPGGCPTSINAGQVVDCGIVNGDFEVKGSNSFAVGMFSQGATVVDPNTATNEQGDPDQSLAIAVKQYRMKYVFLAPTDYEDNYAVVIAPTGATVSLDGVAATASPTALGSSGYGVLRLTLGAGQAGAHVLTASQPVGLQVMGYGSYTSYMYPGGLDLAQIAPPPAN